MNGANGTYVYVLPPVPWVYPVPSPDAAVEQPPLDQPPLTGRLMLDLSPAGSMPLYVDGFYAGTTDEFAGGIELEPGPHRIDIRAPGYEPLSVNVRITAQRTLTVRESMKPRADAAKDANASTPPAAPSQPSPPATFYLIPGCYIGNVPPADAKLPAGCDAHDVQTFKPSM